MTKNLTPLCAALSAAALLVGATALPAAADDRAAIAGAAGWTAVGPAVGHFGPAPTQRLGAILSTEMLGPVTLVQPARPYDLELFAPHLTGAPAAPALAVADPLFGKAPLMAQGVE